MQQAQLPLIQRPLHRHFVNPEVAYYQMSEATRNTQREATVLPCNRIGQCATPRSRYRYWPHLQLQSAFDTNSMRRKTLVDQLIDLILPTTNDLVHIHTGVVATSRNWPKEYNRHSFRWYACHKRHASERSRLSRERDEHNSTKHFSAHAWAGLGCIGRIRRRIICRIRRRFVTAAEQPAQPTVAGQNAQRAVLHAS